MAKLPAKQTKKTTTSVPDDSKIVGLSPTGKKAVGVAAKAISAAKNAKGKATPFKSFLEEMDQYVGEELVQFAIRKIANVAIDYIVPKSSNMNAPVLFETVMKKIAGHVGDEIIKDISGDFYTLVRAKTGAGKRRKSAHSPTTIHNYINTHINYILSLKKQLGIPKGEQITLEEVDSHTKGGSFEALDAYNDPFEHKDISTIANEQTTLTSILAEKYGADKKLFVPGKAEDRIVKREDYYDKAQFDKIDDLLSPGSSELPPERTKGGKLVVNTDVEEQDRARDRLIIRIAATMGARAGGIFSLNLSDVVDIPTKEITDSKGNEQLIWDTPVDTAGMLSIAPRLPETLLLPEKGKMQLRPMWDPKSIQNTFINYFYDTINYRKRHGLPVEPNSPLFMDNRYPTDKRSIKRYGKTFGQRVKGHIVNKMFARIQKHDPKTFPKDQKGRVHGLSVTRRGAITHAVLEYMKDHPGEIVPDEFIQTVAGHTNPNTSWVYALVKDQYKKSLVGSRSMTMEEDTLNQPVTPIQVPAFGEGYDTSGQVRPNAFPGDPDQTFIDEELEEEGGFPSGVEDSGSVDIHDEIEIEAETEAETEAERGVLELGLEDEEVPLELGPEDEEVPLELGPEDEVYIPPTSPYPSDTDSDEEDDEDTTNFNELIRTMLSAGGRYVAELAILKIGKKLENRKAKGKEVGGKKPKPKHKLKSGGVKTPGNVEKSIENVKEIAKHRRWPWKKILTAALSAPGLLLLGGAGWSSILLQTSVSEISERLSAENIDIQSLSAEELKNHVDRIMPDAGPYSRSAIAYYLADTHLLPEDVTNEIYHGGKFKHLVNELIGTDEYPADTDWTFKDTAQVLHEVIGGDLGKIKEYYNQVEDEEKFFDKTATEPNRFDTDLDSIFKFDETLTGDDIDTIGGGAGPDDLGDEDGGENEAETQGMLDEMFYSGEVRLQSDLDEGEVPRVDESGRQVRVGAEDVPTFKEAGASAENIPEEAWFSSYLPQRPTLQLATDDPTSLRPDPLEADVSRIRAFDEREREEGGYRKPKAGVYPTQNLPEQDQDVASFSDAYGVNRESMNTILTSPDSMPEFTEKQKQALKYNVGFVSKKETKPRRPRMARGTPSSPGFADITYG